MKREDGKQQSENSYQSSIAFCYQLGDTNILINDEIEVEILTTSITYKIPHAPPWYIGMTSLRGDILPVVNMHFLLDITQKNASAIKQTLLRLKHPDFPPLVIRIDGLPYQTDISVLMTHCMIPSLKMYPPWVKSVAEYNNKRYLFSNYASLFTALQEDDPEQLIMPTSTYLTSKISSTQH